MYRFDFCSENTLKRPSENLGQVLFGERIEPSPYKVTSSICIDTDTLATLWPRGIKSVDSEGRTHDNDVYIGVRLVSLPIGQSHRWRHGGKLAKRHSRNAPLVVLL